MCRRVHSRRGWWATIRGCALLGSYGATEPIYDPLDPRGVKRSPAWRVRRDKKIPPGRKGGSICRAARPPDAQCISIDIGYSPTHNTPRSFFILRLNGSWQLKNSGILLRRIFYAGAFVFFSKTSAACSQVYGSFKIDDPAYRKDFSKKNGFISFTESFQKFPSHGYCWIKIFLIFMSSKD